MIRYLLLLCLVWGIPCQAQQSVIRDHVAIDVYTYEHDNRTKAAAMPELKAKSRLNQYKRRFEYLLINIPEINRPEKAGERNAIFDLYPNKSKIKKLYLEKYVEDKKLTAYFEETLAPIDQPGKEINKTYSVDELMEVASKFFYCDKVKADTSIQSHVCIGINGLKETKWEKDYTLLAAFCFEAIFHDFDKDSSQVLTVYGNEKWKSCKQFRGNITTLDQYLEDVKLDLFDRMKNSMVLREELLAYYEANKNNLAFKIIR